MSDKRDFHAALSRLAYGHAANTLQFILDEARQIEARVNAYQENYSGRPLVLWPEDGQAVLGALVCPNLGMMVIDGEGVILWCNDVLSGWMGRAPVSCLGQSILDISHSGNADKRRETLAKAMKTGRILQSLDMNTPGQTVENWLIPIPTEDGPRCVVLTRPISRARVFEEAFSDSQRIIE